MSQSIDIVANDLIENIKNQAIKQLNYKTGSSNYKFSITFEKEIELKGKIYGCLITPKENSCHFIENFVTEINNIKYETITFLDDSIKINKNIIDSLNLTNIQDNQINFINFSKGFNDYTYEFYNRINEYKKLKDELTQYKLNKYLKEY